MGVEDTTKTDTRTETTDKPASQERPSAPPPDNPGSPGQPSRLESLRRAREQQEARAQQTQDKDNGGPPREQRDDKATTPEQAGRGNEKAEASGKPEAEDKQQTQDEDQREDKDQRQDDGRPGTDQPGHQDKRDDDPRAQDQDAKAGRESDTGTPGDRDKPQAHAAEPRADTRTEPADKPNSSERQWAPPPDNPGSPGQPSRLESLARAREQQQAAAAQRNESGDGRNTPTAERDVEPPTTQPEHDRATAEPAGKREATAQEQDAGRPRTDEGRTEDTPKPDTSEAPPTPEPNARDADQSTDDDREPHPEPAGPTTDRPTEPQEPQSATTTGEQGSKERATDPPRSTEQGQQTTDSPADDSNQPRPESAEQPTAPANGIDQPHPTDTQTKPGDEPTGQNTETTEPAPDTGSHPDKPGDQPGTDNTPPSSEETDQLPGSQASRGEEDGGHDKKAEDSDAEPSPKETNETDQEGKTNPILLDARSDSQGKVSFEPRYQRGEASGTEPILEEQNRAGQEGIPARRNLDPVDPDRLRNDTGDPLETPEEQDLNESGRDRWENVEAAKTIFNSARTVIDKSRKLAAPEKPSGRPESRPPNAIDNLEQHPNSSDLMSSVFTLAVVGGYAIARLKQAHTKRRMEQQS